MVGQILPDEYMPVDEYGIRADVCIDMNSSVARNNPGQLYETGVNRILEFGRRKVALARETEGYGAAFDTLTDLYNDFNPNYAKLIREAANTPEYRKSLVDDAIDDAPKLNVPPYLEAFVSTPEDHWKALKTIKTAAVKWGAKPSRVTYKSPQADGSVKEFTTIAEFSIGSKYFIHLHKIPEIFATGPAAVNHMGIPTKASSEAKHFPVIQSPYKFGEDEIRMMTVDCPVDEVTRFQGLLSNSPAGVTTTIKAYLLAKHPTRIRRIPISNGELHRTNASVNLTHSITATLGVETKATKLSDVELAAMRAITADDALATLLWDADPEAGRSSTLEDADAKRSRLATGRRDKIEKMFGGDEEEDEGEPIIDPVNGLELLLDETEEADEDGDDDVSVIE